MRKYFIIFCGFLLALLITIIAKAAGDKSDYALFVNTTNQPHTATVTTTPTKLLGDISPAKIDPPIIDQPVATHSQTEQSTLEDVTTGNIIMANWDNGTIKCFPAPAISQNGTIYTFVLLENNICTTIVIPPHPRHLHYR